MTKQQRRYYFWVIVKKVAEYYGWDSDTAHGFIKMNFFMDCNPIIDLASELVSGDVTTTEFLSWLSSLIDKATTTKEMTPMYYEEKFKQIRTKMSPLFFIPLPNETDFNYEYYSINSTED